MGVFIKSETINLELRYSAVNVTKNMTTGQIEVSIPYQVGFYDDSGKWVVKDANVMSASGDSAMILFGINPSTLGKDASTPIGELIDMLAYAVVTGQIKITSSIKINEITSSDVNVTAPTSVYVQVKKNTDVIASFYLDVGQESPEFPALLGADVVITATGFDEVTLNFPILQGLHEIQSVELTPIVTDETGAV